jgi:hypothetical protein
VQRPDRSDGPSAFGSFGEEKSSDNFPDEVKQDDDNPASEDDASVDDAHNAHDTETSSSRFSKPLFRNSAMSVLLFLFMIMDWQV